MKRIVLSIIVTLLFAGVTFSQNLNNGRDAGSTPQMSTSKVITVQPVQDTVKETGPDRDVPEVLKSAESTTDQVITDNLIVTSSLGVGTDMTSGYNFGYNTFVLKENNLRILFDDTSNSGSFPNNDWGIIANDSENGGANYFAIQNVTDSTDIFKLKAGAPANSLYVSTYSASFDPHSAGVGIGTSSPALTLHTKNADTPGLRLEQAGGIVTPQTWDIAGNEANFFIRDVNSNKLPFRIQPGTPTSALTLRSNGNVGIGTWSPAKTLEIETTGDEATIRLERTDGKTWDMVSDTAFSIRSINGEETLPVQIEAGAPTNSFYVDTVGFIGIGNNNPQAKLHVAGDIKVDSVIHFKPIDTLGIVASEGDIMMDSTSHKLKYYNGNDWIALIAAQDLSLNNDSIFITGSDSSISLASYLDNTDEQEISISNDVLTISGSGSNVSLASYMDNTDNQQLSFANDTLRIEDGNSIDLSGYKNTDEQEISLINDVLTISGSGSNVSLASYMDNTDDQQLSLNDNTLTIEGGNSVDLSAFKNDDYQQLSLNDNTLAIEGGNSVSLSKYVNTDSQSISLSGTTLKISGSGHSVDLSQFLDNTDDQVLFLNDNWLRISSTSSKVDLSKYLDNTDEQTLALNGTTLSISSGNSVDLSELLSEQQSQIAELNTQVETLTQELADLKELVSTLVTSSDVSAVTKSSSIDQNIPNPFTTTTVIPYNISSSAKSASIGFYTQTGQLIETVQINERGRGKYTFIPGKSSQIYLYTLYVDGVKVETKKMIYSE